MRFTIDNNRIYLILHSPDGELLLTNPYITCDCDDVSNIHVKSYLGHTYILKYGDTPLIRVTYLSDKCRTAQIKFYDSNKSILVLLEPAKDDYTEFVKL